MSTLENHLDKPIDAAQAMSMVDTYRKRTIAAEIRLRKILRAMKRWEPLGCSIAGTGDGETSVLTVTLSAKLTTEEAFTIAEKLGLEESKLDAMVD